MTAARRVSPAPWPPCELDQSIAGSGSTKDRQPLEAHERKCEEGMEAKVIQAKARDHYALLDFWHTTVHLRSAMELGDCLSDFARALLPTLDRVALYLVTDDGWPSKCGSTAEEDEHDDGYVGQALLVRRTLNLPYVPGTPGVLVIPLFDVDRTAASISHAMPADGSRCDTPNAATDPTDRRKVIGVLVLTRRGATGAMTDGVPRRESGLRKSRESGLRMSRVRRASFSQSTSAAAEPLTAQEHASRATPVVLALNGSARDSLKEAVVATPTRTRCSSFSGALTRFRDSRHSTSASQVLFTAREVLLMAHACTYASQTLGRAVRTEPRAS